MRKLIIALVIMMASSGIANARGGHGHGGRYYQPYVDWGISNDPQVIRAAPENPEADRQWRARCKPHSVDGRMKYAAPGCDLQILN
jgi:hypothetical protein